MTALLTRDAFREGVFARDGHRCVVPGCNAAAADAHHVIERTLWTAPREVGGYFLANGASLCAVHHRLAESNHLPPDALRRWIGTPERKLPEQLAASGRWDKWGHPLAVPARAGSSIKYPSTPYLPWSGTGDHHQEFAQLGDLVDVPLVVTTKMDGANVKFTREVVTARNGDHADQPQFDRLKSLHASLRYAVPTGLVVFAEWLCYTHSIAYRGDLALDGLLQVFAVYDPYWEIFLGWDEVVAIAAGCGLTTVPVLWSGVYPLRWRLEHGLHEIAEQAIAAGHEGVVVRSALPFAYAHFAQRVAKHVRPNHVQLQDGPRALSDLNESRTATPSTRRSNPPPRQRA